MSSSPRAHFPRSTRLERILAWTNTLLAASLLVMITSSVLGWWDLRGVDRHGGIFLFLGAVLLLPEAALFVFAAVGMFRGTPWRWGAQLGPIIAPLIFLGTIAWLTR